MCSLPVHKREKVGLAMGKMAKRQAIHELASVFWSGWCVFDEQPSVNLALRRWKMSHLQTEWIWTFHKHKKMQDFYCLVGCYF